MDQAIGIGVASSQGHDEGVDDELGVLVLVHRPADQPTVAQVADAGDVELAFAGGELGDVGDPAHVRPSSSEVAFEQIRCWRYVEPASAPAATRVDPDQAVGTHQPGDPLAAHAHLAAAQLTVHSWRSVGAARLVMDVADLLEQLTVSDRPSRWWPAPPRVEPRRRHFGQPTQPLHVVDVPVILDEAEAAHRIVSRAK